MKTKALAEGYNPREQGTGRKKGVAAKKPMMGRISKKIVQGDKRVVRAKCPHCFHHKAWYSLDWEVGKCCSCGGPVDYDRIDE